MGKLSDLAPRAITMPGDTRAAIVAALGAVPGLVPSTNVPDVPTPGAAWPAWVQTTFAGTLASPGVPAYDVYVLLPAGYRQDTVEQGDSLLALVVDALWPLGQVQLAEPVTVRFDSSQTMPGLRVRLVMKGN
jgi:hypothetical protein